MIRSPDPPDATRPQWRAAFGRQPVELGAAIVFGRAFFGRDPPAFYQTVQRGIKRALLHLQNIVGIPFDGLRDGVAMRPAQHQSPEDKQVERALQQFDLLLRTPRVFSRHSR